MTHGRFAGLSGVLAVGLVEHLPPGVAPAPPAPRPRLLHLGQEVRHVRHGPPGVAQTLVEERCAGVVLEQRLVGRRCSTTLTPLGGGQCCLCEGAVPRYHH